MRKDVTPDFICIGAPKAGTSWLYSNIKRHPQVKMPPYKELGYFDGLVPGLPLITSIFDPTTWIARKAVIRQLQRGRAKKNQELVRWCLRFLLFPRNDRWYLSLFSPDQGQITGDITPTYASMSSNRVARVHTLAPQTQIIYLLRNPVTQMWSYTAMHFRFWRRGRLKDATDKGLEAYLNRKRRSGIANYSENLQTWESYFQDRIFVGFYDQLVQNPAVLFKDVCRFLQLDASDSVVPKTIHLKRNEGQYQEIPDYVARYLACQYYEQIEKLHKRFSNQYTADWLNYAQRYR